MYNPRSKNKKINSPFPFNSYVIKSYNVETNDNIKALKINSHKIKKEIKSQSKVNPPTHHNDSTQKLIKHNNHSSQTLDQIYTLIYTNTLQKNSSEAEEQFEEKVRKIKQIKTPKNANYIHKKIAAETQIHRHQLDIINPLQNALSLTNNRKNLYRTRQHKHKSFSPTKKINIQSPFVIASFRYALISLYNLLNRRDDYMNELKGKKTDSLYIPLKAQQIQQIFKKYIQTKGRDKGRVKFNYITSEQLRSLKFKGNGKSGVTVKKQKKQKVVDDDEYSQEEEAEGQQKPQLVDYATWKRRNGVGQNQKVFIVKGGYAQLRKTLLSKGWFENEDVWSPYFDFKWTTKIYDIDFMSLRPHQTVNHFNNNQHLTSKYGITRRLKTLYLHHQIDIDKFYPRCYDLADLVDFQNFIENFKFGFAETIIKRFLVDKERYKNLELKVRTAYDILKRRTTHFKTLVNEINKGYNHLIKPEEWKILTQTTQYTEQIEKQKLSEMRKKQSNQIPLEEEKLLSCSSTSEDSARQNTSHQNMEKQAQNAECKTFEEKIFSHIHIKIEHQLVKLAKNDPQLNMNGFRNVWIAKPNFLSRGRGIRCYNNLYDIINYCCGGTGQFVVQKYIENPLLIEGKKFDIRQWVLIQDYNPPKIWFYDQSYVRFCADQYSLDNIRNRFQHLTNNSVQKYNKNNQIDKSMWEKDEFIQFVGKDKWQEIQEKMKNIVVWTIKSCEGFVNGRKGSCELVGYDFMIDEDLNPWLIEINMSPSMEYSTPITKKLVKMVLQDTAKVLSSNKKNLNEIGGFKCIYKNNEDLENFQKYKL